MQRLARDAGASLARAQRPEVLRRARRHLAPQVELDATGVGTADRNIEEDAAGRRGHRERRRTATGGRCRRAERRAPQCETRRAHERVAQQGPSGRRHLFRRILIRRAPSDPDEPNYCSLYSSRRRNRVQPSFFQSDRQLDVARPRSQIQVHLLRGAVVVEERGPLAQPLPYPPHRSQPLALGHLPREGPSRRREQRVA